MARKSKSLSDAIDRAPPERWCHGSRAIETEIGQQGDTVVALKVQRIDTPVLTLRRGGKIGDAEVEAASRWLRDFESTMRSPYVHPATAGIRGGNAGGMNTNERKLDASSRYRAACQAIGREGEALLYAACHLGLSIEKIRDDLSISWGRVSSILQSTLTALAAHYQEVDRHSKFGLPREFREVA